uniref:C-type lectin domain-containing protein n=1 Tax=Magallana gigas TaxID=29159 RepID=A0A8W8KNQ8_MAGGI
MSRNLELDNYVLNETKFRIQAIHEINRPQCVHQCLRHGKECEGVLVNEIRQHCWLLKCSMNQRFIQKGFMEMESGWNFYKNDKACKPGWTPYSSHCYYFGNSLKYTWNETSFHCQELGGYLVRIENEEENTWLTTIFPIDEIEADKYFAFAVWIGAISLSPTGPYKWGLSGPILDYQPWYPGEPTNSAEELCVNLLASGLWNNVPCMLRYYFICESE